MKDRLHLSARSICILLALCLLLEMAVALTMFHDLGTRLAVLAMIPLAYFTGSPLARPDEAIRWAPAFLTSMPSLIVMAAGAAILAGGIASWLVWFGVAAGFMVGNRLRAADILRT